MGVAAIRAFFAGRTGEAHRHEQSLVDPVTVAACALLLEIAHADDVFSAEERERIARHIREERGVSAEEMREVFQAAEEERRESVDLYHFTRLLSENLSREQRRRLVETIWEVVYADGSLSMIESHLARRVAELLGFQHPEVQEIKDRVARERGVFPTEERP
jgi:uncharacterized tellurite resistance protein B-like protein